MSKGPRIPMRRPGPPASPARAAPAQLDVAALHDALELACMNALMGDPPGPLLAARLKRECQGVLMGYGLSRADVTVTSTRKGTAVSIRLPRQDQTVQEIVLRLH